MIVKTTLTVFIFEMLSMNRNLFACDAFDFFTGLEE